MTTKLVRHDVRGDVAILTLDPPESRNALSTGMLEEIASGLEDVDADDDLRASVIAGGRRIFAAGANLRELKETSPGEYLTGPRGRAWRRIPSVEKPVVAAVAGAALGGGCELALSCDAIVAGDGAVLGQPEVKLGLLPGAGGTQRWARSGGRYRAARVVIGGETVSAWQARELGVVEHIVPDDQVLEAAIDLASDLGAQAPLAVRLAKRALRLSEELPLDRALEQERVMLAALLGTDDAREGITAFLERRAPDFRGR